MVKWHYSAGALLLMACAQDAPPAQPAAPQLEQVWRLAGLANPESVALSGDGGFLYVSNVNGEADAHDGNGFISRVSLDGRMLQREFATGLDAPKGLMAGGNAIYVTDINQLVVLDAQTGAISRRVPIQGARFLNDLAFAPDGRVIMSDSGTQRIYAVDAANNVEIWLEHELLRSINGLMPEAERLVVATMAGRLLAIDYETREITVLAEGLGDADAAAAIGGGRYVVSHWPGRMNVVGADGAHETIIDTTAEGRYWNDFTQAGDLLYIAHYEPSEIGAYRVVQAAP